jgi:hypothetical protein
LFAGVPKRITVGQVWVYNEAEADPARRLRQIPLQLGLSDGQFSEVVSGDVTQGMELVTSVTMPITAQRRGFGSLFQPQQRGRPGMTKGEDVEPPRLNRGGRRGGANRGGGRGRN